MVDGCRRDAVANALEVGNRRTGVQLFIQSLERSPLVLLAERHDLGRIIVEIAKHNRLAGAGLGAGRGDLAICHRLDTSLLIVADVAQALDAEVALLHHALGTHGDFRIEQELQRRMRHLGLRRGRTLGDEVFLDARQRRSRALGTGAVRAVFVPVEAADLVGAIVGAVTGTIRNSNTTISTNLFRWCNIYCFIT